MEHFNNFIIIDDYKINNQLCTKIIQKLYPKAQVTDFTDPEEGFLHIAEKYAKLEAVGHVVLLLDINMPLMNAWDFLEKFDELSDLVKSRVHIYILSSSVDKGDMARAKANKYVEYYLIKPLTSDSIRIMLKVLCKKLGIPES